MKVFEELSLIVRARYPMAYLVTWEERRAERGLRKLARQLDRPLWRWSASAGLDAPGQPDESREPAALLRRLAAHTEPLIAVLYDLHAWLSDPLLVRQLRDMTADLASRRQCLILVSPTATVPRELEKDIVVVDLPLPQVKEIARLFHTLLRGEGLEVDVDLFERFVKASLGLTEEEIKRVYSKVLLQSGTFAEDQLAQVIAEKSQIIRRSEFLEFHDLADSFGDVGGLDNLKRWLEARERSFTERARQFGLPQPKGVFLVGVQGCGKSLTAKAVASLWRVPLLRLDVGALLASQGTTEEGLRNTIRIAESLAPTVLWVDEIEKGFAGVSSGSSDTAAATRVFGNFVTWLQEKKAPVFVVATANEVRNLPPELLRKGRFDEIFFVDLPNVHERQTILEIHLRRAGRAPAAFDTWALAEITEKFSGAELEQAVTAGLYEAFARDHEVQTSDIVRAVRATVPLAVTMDQQIKELREWARTRTRPATYDTRRIDFFEEWEGLPDDEVGLDALAP